MQKIEFEVTTDEDLIKAVIDRLPSLSRYEVEKIIKRRDLKVNNFRVRDLGLVKAGDKIVLFYQDKSKPDWFSTVYEDENVWIVNKRAGIEVVSENERDLLSVLKLEMKKRQFASRLVQGDENVETAQEKKKSRLKKIKENEIFPIHRLDRNTEGLVIFAKNEMAQKELLSAFKERKSIEKRYALLVHGHVDISRIKRTVYLKKVENLSKVWISEIKTSGYEPIKTEFSLVKHFAHYTLLEAKLITGKTHQIRAHIAYYGYPIVGDNKYGQDGEKVMHLTANALAFNFNEKSPLAYLNKLNFEIAPSWLE